MGGGHFFPGSVGCGGSRWNRPRTFLSSSRTAYLESVMHILWNDLFPIRCSLQTIVTSLGGKRGCGGWLRECGCGGQESIDSSIERASGEQEVVVRDE